MADNLEIEESVGSPFDDFEIVDVENKKLKTALAVKIVGIISERNLTQSEVASVIGLSQPDVSNISNFKLKGFTIDRLLNAVYKLGCNVEIDIGDGDENCQGSCRLFSSKTISRSVEKTRESYRTRHIVGMDHLTQFPTEIPVIVKKVAGESLAPPLEVAWRDTRP